MNRYKKRYQKVDVCGECGLCNKTLCEPARLETLRDYIGIRFTADGFDCALPVSLDSHTHCSYACKYCFSDNLMQHRSATQKPVGQLSLSKVEALFAGEPRRDLINFQKALKYDNKVNGYPCPVQLGAINDPCDHIERQQGWLLEFIPLAIKYKQPVRISTKGTIFQLLQYQKAIAEHPELFWVAFSIISIDDDILRRVDRRAPVPSERLKTMKILSDLGVKTSLRFRPIIPGIPDATPAHPHAWRELIDAAAEAGAKAISYETAFLPGVMTKDLHERWESLSQYSGVGLERVYTSFGRKDACMRPAYTWVEEIMHKIAEHAHSVGMTVGVSDPVWKQLWETGCCCGILPDDPVFGNWQRESATHQLLEAKKTGKEITLQDVTPAWAYDQGIQGMVLPGVGPRAAYKHRHEKWADHIEHVWNKLDAQRSPLNYFQGALMPVRRDEAGNMVYRYEGLKRQNKKSTIWKVDE